MKLKLIAITGIVATLAAVTTLAAGGGHPTAMTDDDEMLMMALMGGGIEDPSAAPELASSASTRGVLSTESASATGFRSIDVPGAVATRALGINARGEIVGSYTDAAGMTHGFRWRNGNVTTIAFPGANHTEAWGINPRGDIVGRYRVAGDTRIFGFLLRRGVYTDISVAGHLNTLPIKITPSGVIVGCFHDTNFLRDMRGYVQRGDRVESFELLPSTMHNGVARNGRLIAGISFESMSLVHGYVLDRGRYRQFDYPGATFTSAQDVSPSGTVVGYFEPVTSHGFVLDDDGFTRIDVPGANWTRIFGINPQEDIVGTFADASGLHGFLLPSTGTDEEGDDDDEEDDG
jgi:probable HAF family extracellular repeat protein